MSTFFTNLKYAIRVLAKRPRFSLLIITILALGIGANTAIFSVVNTVLIKPLPYDHPERIVRISESKLDAGLIGVGISHPTINFWRQHNTVFEDISGSESHRFYVETGQGKPFYTRARAVSACYFSIMGMRPLLGRDFLGEEEQPGRERVVMLSHEFWTQHYQANPQIIDQSLVLNEKPYTIIGVMPAEFRDSLNHCALFWVPLPLELESWSGGTGVYARLRSDVSLSHAKSQMDIIEERLVQQHPEHKKGYTVDVRPYFASQLNHSRACLYPIWGAIALVLLIGCFNTSGLFLVHGDTRRKEIAVRIALGASRWQIIKQMLIEGLLLSSTAGMVGLIMATLVIKSLVIMSPITLPRLSETQMDINTLVYTLGVSVLTGLVFSLVPAWKVTSFHLTEAMKQGFHGQTHHQRRLQGCLVIGQIGMALTLVFAVALLVQSVISIYQTELGFRPEHTLVVEFELPEIKYPNREDSLAFFQQLQQRMQIQPDVISAAYTSGGLVLGGGGGFISFIIDGAPPLDPGQEPLTRCQTVSSNFFQAMGMTILRGRGFTQQDVELKTQVCVIDENMVKLHFIDQDPLKQSINGRRVIGVVSTIKDYDSLAPDIVTLYRPVTNYCFVCSDLVIKATGDPLVLANAVRTQVAELDPDLTIGEIYALKDSLADMMAPRRYIALLLALFALIALLLAAIGIYGLLRYMVEQRFNEIGIRMALGATTGNITRAFLRKGVILLLTGTSLGLIGGYASKQILTSFLYEAQFTNLILLTVAIVILFATGLLCYIPARRASRIDPMEALRYE